ncbi:Putative poly O-acetylase [Campylobacter concisus UNSWCD]|nr:Putative poly O-acetylase [Campylobacter concisus UNSWCD]
MKLFSYTFLLYFLDLSSKNKLFFLNFPCGNEKFMFFIAYLAILSFYF